MPRKIVEALPSGAALTWTEDAPVGGCRIVEALPDGRRRFVEVMPSAAELCWIEGGGGDAPSVETA